jgi:hypothetical protein
VRTTINLDDETYNLVSLYATLRGITTLGEAIADLIRKSQSVSASSRIRRRGSGGFPVMPSRGQLVTSELVKELDQADWIAKRFA